MIKAKVEIIRFETGTEWDDITDEIDEILTIPSLYDLEEADYRSYFRNDCYDSSVQLTKDLSIKIVTFSYVVDDEETEHYDVVILNTLEECMGWDSEYYKEYQLLFRDKDEGEYKMDFYWDNEDFDVASVECNGMVKL